jgi:uncharacterized protein YndB with AHSA1/START domain
MATRRKIEKKPSTKTTSRTPRASKRPTTAPAKMRTRPTRAAAEAPSIAPLSVEVPPVDEIVQRVTLPAAPRVVWDAYLDAAHHERFTGSPASIDRRVGGKFRAYDGYIEGVILELVAPTDKGEGRIVQSWRASDFPPEYPHSKVEITLAPAGQKTTLTLRHSGVPRSMVKAFARGWEEFYWEPLARILRK